MKKIDLTNIEDLKEFKALTPGGYICQILDVKDFPEKEYLAIKFDIAEGEFKGYYAERERTLGFAPGQFIRSYKEKALPFFKNFITSVEKSNKNYKFNSDETTLIGKYFGVVLGKEEYVSNEGELKERLTVVQIHSAAKIKNNEYTVPDTKKYKSSSASQVNAPKNFELIEDGDVPF